MTTSSKDQKTNTVLLFLISATLFSWWAIEGGTGQILNIDKRSISILITVVAALKVYFVIMHFMEINTAPLLLKAILITWLSITSTGIVLLFLNPSRAFLLEGI